MFWWILYAIAITSLLLHWGRPNAVWGTATVGCVIGVIVSLVSGFDWWTIAKSVAIAATLGTIIEWLPRLLKTKT